jgi:hypothetical protein
MDHLRLRRRDRGRDRVSRLTKTVASGAAVGALLVSVGAARSNPGRFTSPPKAESTVASGRPAHHHHRRVRSDPGGSSTLPQQTIPAPPAATNPPAVTATPAPPVVVSGGS